MRIKKENDSPHGFAILAVIVLSITDFLLSNLIIANVIVYTFIVPLGAMSLRIFEFVYISKDLSPQ
jgi:hypothetical protein